LPRPGKRGAASKSREERVPGAFLTILDGREAGKEVTIEEGLTIGRTIENAVVVVDAGVSRQHAQIRCEGGVYTLSDLGSANGTILNDQKISGVEVLRSDDVIIVGATGMQFTAPEDGKPMFGESTRLANLGDVEGGGRDTDPGIAAGARAGKRSAVLGAIVALLVAVVGGLLFGGYKLLQKAEVIGPPDLSSEVIPVSDSNEFFDKSFGYGRFDEQHPSMVTFSFNYLRGRATIQYAAWGVETQGEVQMAVNGTVVGTVPTTGGAWRYGLYQEIPRQLLRPGPDNFVTFRQTRDDAWEVGYLRIKQDPLLPPNPTEADNQIQLARKLHEDRDVEPANLWNAMLKYRLAADLLELANPRPQAYRDAVEMADRINIELNEVFQQGRFSAERAYRFGDLEQARDFVLRTIAYFPDHRDVRYRELEQYTQALDSGE
jgi:hypothetical protein